MLEKLKGMLAACGFLLEVAKSALADFVVLETEARTAHDQLDADVNEEIRKRPRQTLAKAQADSEVEELKPKNASLLSSTASHFMLKLSFSLVRRGHSPNWAAVQEINLTCWACRETAVEVCPIVLPTILCKCRSSGVADLPLHSQLRSAFDPRDFTGNHGDRGVEDGQSFGSSSRRGERR